MGAEPIVPVFHTVSIDTMLNNNGVKNGHGLKNGMCERPLTKKDENGRIQPSLVFSVIKL